jgi:nucleotide-binding universal stress UspA family protein
MEAAMVDRRQQRIVVGVSGSWASQAALGWAVGEAMLRSAALHVVHIWDPTRHTAPYATGACRTTEEERQSARDRLAAAMRAEFGLATPECITAVLAEGLPERVLVELSAGIDLLVLGSAAVAAPAGRSAGPVVRACLMHARCPLMIITTTVGPPGIIKGRQLTPPRDGSLQDAAGIGAV